ncbi:LisH protein [Babesia caballi]|uniref:LisH protein n=1 Tax=Babesia caballi TaxID=5871 RepID=A0AAV4M4J6_BABCB|nr:LisH protein [Babesia caballi]
MRSRPWESQFTSIDVDEAELEEVVVNYLVTNMYHETYAALAEDLGIDGLKVAESILQRRSVKAAILEGKMEEACKLIEDIDTSILHKNVHVHFALLSKNLIDLIKADDVKGALEYARAALAPCLRRDTSLIERLEEVMGLISFSNFDSLEAQQVLQEVEQTERTAQIADEALLEHFGQEKRVLLEQLVKHATWLQCKLLREDPENQLQYIREHPDVAALHAADLALLVQGHTQVSLGFQALSQPLVLPLGLEGLADSLEVLLDAPGGAAVEGFRREPAVVFSGDASESMEESEASPEERPGCAEGDPPTSDTDAASSSPELELSSNVTCLPESIRSEAHVCRWSRRPPGVRERGAGGAVDDHVAAELGAGLGQEAALGEVAKQRGGRVFAGQKRDFVVHASAELLVECAQQRLRAHERDGRPLLGAEALRHAFGHLEHVRGNPREAGDVDAVGLGARAERQLVEEGQRARLVVEGGGHVARRDVGELERVGADLLEVGGEHAARADGGDLLQAGGRDGGGVEGRGAATELVDENEGVAGGLRQRGSGKGSAYRVQNGRHLLQLNQEGALALDEVVGRSQAREHALRNKRGKWPHSQPTRNKGTHLRHDRAQRGLAQQGRLAAHVGAGEQQEAVEAAAAELQVVGHEGLGVELADHGVGAAADEHVGLAGPALEDLGADHGDDGALGHGGEAAETVELGGSHQQAAEDVAALVQLPHGVLEKEELALGQGELVLLQLLQERDDAAVVNPDVAGASGRDLERLGAGGETAVVALREFDLVAELGVDELGGGALALHVDENGVQARLGGGNALANLVGGRPDAVAAAAGFGGKQVQPGEQLLAVGGHLGHAGGHALQERGAGLAEPVGVGEEGGDVALQTRKLLEQLVQLVELRKHVFVEVHGHLVAAGGGVEHLAEGALEVGHGGELLLVCGADGEVAAQKVDGGAAGVDAGDAAQRLEQPPPQHALAQGAAGLVQELEEAHGLVAFLRLEELQLGERGSVERHALGVVGVENADGAVVEQVVEHDGAQVALQQEEEPFVGGAAGAQCGARAFQELAVVDVGNFGVLVADVLRGELVGAVEGGELEAEVDRHAVEFVQFPDVVGVDDDFGGFHGGYEGAQLAESERDVDHAEGD